MQLGNRLLKIDELANLIGYSEGHIRNLVSQKQIPFIKLSRKALRFDPAAIEAWIQERNHASKASTSEHELATATADRRVGPPDRRTGPPDRRRK